jgi:uncharacterized protein (TIGR03437 family)
MAAGALPAQLRVLAVANAAGFAPGLPQNGGLASLFVTGLVDLAGVTQANQVPLPTELRGVRIRFVSQAGSAPVFAPILAVADLGSYQQINFQVPWDTNRQGPAALLHALPFFDGEAAIDIRTQAGGGFFTNA